GFRFSTRPNGLHLKMAATLQEFSSACRLRLCQILMPNCWINSGFGFVDDVSLGCPSIFTRPRYLNCNCNWKYCEQLLQTLKRLLSWAVGTARTCSTCGLTAPL